MSTVQIPEELLQKLIASISNTNGTPVLFRDWSRRWMQTYARGRVKDNTYQGNYVEPIELHLIPYFGESALSDIHPIDVQAFFRSKKETSALGSLQKMKSCLSGIFETAIENDLCWKNPVTSTLRVYSNVEPKVKHTWTQHEYDVAFDFAGQHPAGLDVRVLMETAITRSELLGLSWVDFNAKEKLLYLNNGLVSLKNSDTGTIELVCDGLKNKYRQRTIPLSSELTWYLENKPREIYVGGNAHKQIPFRALRPRHIFYSPCGKAFTPSNWYHRNFSSFMRDLTERYPEVTALSPHELRHTRATLLKDQGIPLYSIARLLGHCDLDMMMKHYAHDNPEALRTALRL